MEEVTTPILGTSATVTKDEDNQPIVMLVNVKVRTRLKKAFRESDLRHVNEGMEKGDFQTLPITPHTWSKKRIKKIRGKVVVTARQRLTNKKNSSLKMKGQSREKCVEIMNKMISTFNHENSEECEVLENMTEVEKHAPSGQDETEILRTQLAAKDAEIVELREVHHHECDLIFIECGREQSEIQAKITNLQAELDKERVDNTKTIQYLASGKLVKIGGIKEILSVYAN
ncbi:hypothetical protein K7X08_028920 [Anisodus acutangulus]|uniref:Uncharacterized protein n=1 Tax=Anisodus acutangulus TaxID=402998 RepID=A0A9Q1QSE4_9SOLA|nr:hypothetical protein K7X08_028920 [Anisodus acutangulus]